MSGSPLRVLSWSIPQSNYFGSKMDHCRGTDYEYGLTRVSEI